MKNFLIIDDDVLFCEALMNNFIKKGFKVKTANNYDQIIQITKNFNPDGILLDLKIKDTSGLELIPQLLQIYPKTKIVILTGYASINTAIEAIKLGAIYYLAKPVSTEDIINAFNKHEANPQTPVEVESIKLNKAERDHILSTFERNERNISATARELGMHRRTLQRKLTKLL